MVDLFAQDETTLAVFIFKLGLDSNRYYPIEGVIPSVWYMRNCVTGLWKTGKPVLFQAFAVQTVCHTSHSRCKTTVSDVS
jgi:hypothetical protein